MSEIRDYVSYDISINGKRNEADNILIFYLRETMQLNNTILGRFQSLSVSTSLAT